MIETLAISGYRSLRELVLPLDRLNLVTGANGSGKSSLYRALRLLADAAGNAVVASLAREGGLASTFWAGPETIARGVVQGDYRVEATAKRGAASLKLGFAGEPHSYAIDLGYPPPPGVRTMFLLDPAIKREAIWHGPVYRPAAAMVERRNAVVSVRGGRDSEATVLSKNLSAADSMLAAVADMERAPEMLAVRETIRGWRFYDGFRTDALSPVRMAQVGTHTPVLNNEGTDLAAALQTILEVGDAEALERTVDDAFPGSRLEISADAGRFEVRLRQHGLLRPLGVAELSDGTLRFLLWTAALLTARPPALMVLNEPETSLHPDLLPALGRLIVAASRRGQVLVVSHAAGLIEPLREAEECRRLHLVKEFGETKVEGLGLMNTPRWQWPKR